MRIVRLENGEFALEIPLQGKEEYIKVKKYKPYGQPVDKKAITTIKEDIYVEWEISRRCQDSVNKFLQSIYDCCKYGIYIEQDILNYRNFIEQPSEIEEIDPSKTYCQTIDGTGSNTTYSRLETYGASNSQSIPQKNKKWPFWIEFHPNRPKNSQIIIPNTMCHICFRIDVDKILGENFYFILDSSSAYMFLETCRIFARLKNDSNFNINCVQNTFTICLGLFEIAKTFGLKPDEYIIDNSLGDSKSYSIYPKDKDNDKVIINKFPKDLRIFNEYTLSFKHCIFMFEEVEEKKHGLSFKTRNDGRKILHLKTP